MGQRMGDEPAAGEEVLSSPRRSARPGASHVATRKRVRRSGRNPEISQYLTISPGIPHIPPYPAISRRGYGEKNRPGEGSYLLLLLLAWSLLLYF